MVSRHFDFETGVPWVGRNGLRVAFSFRGYCECVSVPGKPTVPIHSCPSEEQSAMVHFSWAIFSGAVPYEALLFLDALKL